MQTSFDRTWLPRIRHVPAVLAYLGLALAVVGAIAYIVFTIMLSKIPPDVPQPLEGAVAFFFPALGALLQMRERYWR